MDLALESEFNETMEIFDIFVNNMSTNDKRLNHEIDVNANKPLAIKASDKNEKRTLYERRVEMKEALRASTELNMA